MVLPGELSCISCSYPLGGLDRDGRCPECGTPLHCTIEPFTGGTALAEGIERLRRCLTWCFLLVLAINPWVAAVVCVSAAIPAVGGVLSLLHRAQLRRIGPLRARLHALLMAWVMQGTVPLGLAVAGRGALEAAYAAAATCLVSAYASGAIGIRVARPIGYERIVLQLRSARLLMYAAAASAIIPGIFAMGSFRGFLAGHLALLGPLGLIALGHTVVALAELSKAVRVELASRASATGGNGAPHSLQRPEAPAG